MPMLQLSHYTLHTEEIYDTHTCAHLYLWLHTSGLVVVVNIQDYSAPS